MTDEITKAIERLQATRGGLKPMPIVNLNDCRAEVVALMRAATECILVDGDILDSLDDALVALARRVNGHE